MLKNWNFRSVTVNSHGYFCWQSNFCWQRIIKKINFTSRNVFLEHVVQSMSYFSHWAGAPGGLNSMNSYPGNVSSSAYATSTRVLQRWSIWACKMTFQGFKLIRMPTNQNRALGFIANGMSRCRNQFETQPEPTWVKPAQKNNQFDIMNRRTW